MYSRLYNIIKDRGVSSTEQRRRPSLGLKAQVTKSFCPTARWLTSPHRPPPAGDDYSIRRPFPINQYMDTPLRGEGGGHISSFLEIQWIWFECQKYDEVHSVCYHRIVYDCFLGRFLLSPIFLSTYNLGFRLNSNVKRCWFIDICDLLIAWCFLNSLHVQYWYVYPHNMHLTRNVSCIIMNWSRNI